jgi:diguanylate cyclase (GGDEF)-like protein
MLLKRQASDPCAIAVMLLDLDHFKSINDRFGHALGDHVLQLFTQAGSRCMRRMDLFGRLGGEEFAALLYDTNRDKAFGAAEEIRTTFEQATREVEGKPVNATVSIGMVISHDAVLDLSALLAQADHALYRAKDSGRNRVEIASIDLVLERIKRPAERPAAAEAEMDADAEADEAAKSAA